MRLQALLVTGSIVVTVLRLFLLNSVVRREATAIMTGSLQVFMFLLCWLLPSGCFISGSGMDCFFCSGREQSSCSVCSRFPFQHSVFLKVKVFV